jgi:hypothetical protein
MIKCTVTVILTDFISKIGLRIGAKSFPARAFVCATAIVALTVQSAESMDNTIATVGASVFQYANYLYLSDLYGKPTAIRLYDKFCPDTLNADQAIKLKQNLSELKKSGLWTMDCAPVKVILTEHSPLSFDLRMRYLNLTDDAAWIGKFQDALSPDFPIPERLLAAERQLELSRSILPELKTNPFSSYGARQFIDHLFTDVRKLGKVMSGPTSDGPFGEVSFRTR